MTIDSKVFISSTSNRILSILTIIQGNLSAHQALLSDLPKTDPDYDTKYRELEKAIFKNKYEIQNFEELWAALDVDMNKEQWEEWITKVEAFKLGLDHEVYEYMDFEVNS